MKKLTKEAIDQLALKMRLQAGLNPSEPIHTKTLLRKLGIMVIYRPLSEKACGLSMRSADGRAKFMLINSDNSRGRQHFTICHKLFHLYYDEEPNRHISTATMLRVEQLFGVSHQSLCYCLRHLRLLTEEELQDHLAESMEIQQIATEYGYDLSLYQPGNEGVVIGDFGEKARLLFEQERISEGHYVELLNLLK